MYKEFYVFDIRGDGYTDIYSEYESTSIVDRLMTTPHCVFVGKYATYEEAEEAAEEYENEMQDAVDKVVGNYDDEDYVPLTQEDYDLDDEDDFE